MYIVYSIKHVYSVKQSNVEYLKTSQILKVSTHFDICSFVQVSRNSGFSCLLKNVLYFGKEAINNNEILV